jgi:hypothetical protein
MAHLPKAARPTVGVIGEGRTTDFTGFTDEEQGDDVRGMKTRISLLIPLTIIHLTTPACSLATIDETTMG